MNNTKHYGLDFGTTNSSIAIEEDGVGKILAIDKVADDPRVVRSMTYYLPRTLIISEKVNPQRLAMNLFYQWELTYEGEQQTEIGQQAVSQYLADNQNRHAGIKREIMTGKFISLSANADEVAEKYTEYDFGTSRLMQALKTGLKSKYYKGTTIFGQFYPLEELIGKYVGQLKQIADQSHLEDISSVTVGRPVYFLGDPERDQQVEERLKLALQKAGFSDIKFQYEPVAAAKQFIRQSGLEAETVLVFDFGGGTLDTAIVEVKDGQEKVLAVDGVYIGGDLLNADIMEHKLWPYFGSLEIHGDHGLPVSRHIYEPLNSWFSLPNLNNPDMINNFERLRYKHSNSAALDRLIHLIKANLGFDLYEAIEVAKKQLSFSDTARIQFQQGIIDIDVEISRTEFEAIIEPRVRSIAEVLINTLAKAKLQPEQIDVVVRTGGSSLIPVFESLLVEMFGRDKIKQFDTFTSIAGGLALE